MIPLRNAFRWVGRPARPDGVPIAVPPGARGTPANDPKA
jgi:hypothetical protein